MTTHLSTIRFLDRERQKLMRKLDRTANPTLRQKLLILIVPLDVRITKEIQECVRINDEINRSSIQ